MIKKSNDTRRGKDKKEKLTKENITVQLEEIKEKSTGETKKIKEISNINNKDKTGHFKTKNKILPTNGRI